VQVLPKLNNDEVGDRLITLTLKTMLLHFNLSCIQIQITKVQPEILILRPAILILNYFLS